MSLTLRLASGSGRSAVVRQALVVVGTAVASALLLLAVGVATLTRDAFALAGEATVSYDESGAFSEVVVEGSRGTLSNAYLVQPGLRIGVVIGLVLCVVPLLVFVATASRVAARRRDERLAALRLAGATRAQVTRLAVLDTLVGGVAGALLGVVGYVAGRSLALAVGGEVRAIAEATTPPVLLAVVVILLLEAALAAGAALTLRSVNTTPLGVARRAPRRRPRPWGLALVAVALVAVNVLVRAKEVTGGDAAIVLLCLGLVMLGLVASGSWLTSAVGRRVAGRTQSAALLLAGRRLDDDPTAQARAMSAVVLVVFAAGVALVALQDALTINGDVDPSQADFLRQGYGAAFLGMAVSLIVGASGLLLTTGEGLLERRRTFAALHASGVPLSTLRRSVLAQVALPVLPAATVASVAALVLGAAVMGTDKAFSGVALMALLLPFLATAMSVTLAATTLPFLRSVTSEGSLRTA